MKKNDFRYIFLFLAFALVFAGCEEKDNLPYPEDTKIGVIPKVDRASTSDGYVDVQNPGDITLDINVDVVSGEYDELKLYVVYNGNYADQYLVETLSKADVVSLGESDLVSLIDVIDAIQEAPQNGKLGAGDLLTFFVNPVIDGYEFKTFAGDSAKSYNINPAQLANPMASWALNYVAAVPYDPTDFEGTFDAVENGSYEYEVTIEQDPDNQENGLIVHDLFWSGSVYKIEIDLSTFEVNAEDQKVLAEWSAAWGGSDTYGAIYFDNCRNGLCNTYARTLSFTVDANLNDTGYTFGAATFDITPTAGKKDYKDMEEKQVDMSSYLYR